MDWKKFYPGDVSHVSLPAFPWQRERHWAEASIMRASRLDLPTHPHLQIRLRTAAPSWNAWLDLDTLGHLRDHRAQEHIIFPGSGYVETAFAMGAALFDSRPVELEDVQFQKALVLPDGKDPLQFQSVYSPGDDTVKFSSRASGEASEWTVNATAKLRPLASARPDRQRLQPIRKNLPVKLSGEQVYAIYEHRGLFYGPAFRGVKSVWRREGECLGEVRLPKSSLANGIEKYQFHPALLDACFQTLIFSASASRIWQRSTNLLPQRIDRVKFFARPGNHVFCHARLVHGQFLFHHLGFRDSGSLRPRTRGLRRLPRPERPRRQPFGLRWRRKLALRIQVDRTIRRLRHQAKK